MQSPEELRREGAYLFARLFGQVPDEVLLGRYAAAHAALGLAVPEPWLRSLRRLRERNLDAEAVEYVLRLRERRNPLSLKTALLHYLAEGRGQCRGLFHAEGGSRLAGAAAVLRILAGAAYCYVKGSYLVRRHRLA